MEHSPQRFAVSKIFRINGAARPAGNNQPSNPITTMYKNPKSPIYIYTESNTTTKGNIVSISVNGMEINWGNNVLGKE